MSYFWYIVISADKIIVYGTARESILAACGRPLLYRGAQSAELITFTPSLVRFRINSGAPEYGSRGKENGVGEDEMDCVSSPLS